MKKKDELTNPDSCLSRATEDEWVFVLLGRDKTTANTIRFWVSERVRLGKNKVTDYQIVSAMEVARAIDLEHL